jgi:hypothetical protein
MTVTITYTIPGVPLLDQLHSLTSDGGPDENERYNCVFTCNAALATAYLHRPFNGDQIKDMDNNYGQGYIGGAAEFYLVDTMRSLGITVTALKSDTQQGLVDILHREIAAGQDIVALEAQLAAALTHVAQLEQQLQNQPAPVPTPVETPPDPKAVEALAAVMELAKALKLVAGSSQAAA